MKQHQIHQSRNATYLGVTVDEHLKWLDHIERIVCKANSVNAFLRRNINSCPSHIRKMCYLAMVQPILEYSSVVWSPFTDSNIHRVEMVQRRAATFITHNFSPRTSETEMLNNLNSSSLEERHSSLKLAVMYKILHNFVRTSGNQSTLNTNSKPH